MHTWDHRQQKCPINLNLGILCSWNLRIDKRGDVLWLISPKFWVIDRSLQRKFTYLFYLLQLWPLLSGRTLAPGSHEAIIPFLSVSLSLLFFLKMHVLMENLVSINNTIPICLCILEWVEQWGKGKENEETSFVSLALQRTGGQEEEGERKALTLQHGSHPMSPFYRKGLNFLHIYFF